MKVSSSFVSCWIALHPAVALAAQQRPPLLRRGGASSSDHRQPQPQPQQQQQQKDELEQQLMKAFEQDFELFAADDEGADFWDRVLQQQQSSMPRAPTSAPTAALVGRCGDIQVCGEDGSFVPIPSPDLSSSNITNITRIAMCAAIESLGETRTVCPPAFIVPPLLGRNDANFCGRCPIDIITLSPSIAPAAPASPNTITPSTNAPILGSPSAPTGSPTSAPSSGSTTTTDVPGGAPAGRPTTIPTLAPTFDLSQCDPLIPCGAEQNGVTFCFQGRNDGNLNIDACVPLNLLPSVFPFGKCGKCPTEAPTLSPTESPTESIELCGDTGEIIRCDSPSLPNVDPGEGVKICVGLNNNGRLVELCVDEDNLGLFLPGANAQCGLCPTTDAPTSGPTTSSATSPPPTTEETLTNAPSTPGSTPIPTKSPTNSPTDSPTSLGATADPSASPTETPSQAPSNSPTASPTITCDPKISCGDGDDTEEYDGVVYCLPLSKDFPTSVQITICLPEDALQDTASAQGGFCGPCPTESPTQSPSAAPTDVLNGCDPVEACDDGGEEGGVVFCFQDSTKCLSKDLVQIGLQLGGVCGPCDTESPTVAPTELPTEAPSSSPSTSPTVSPTLTPTALVPPTTPSPTGSPTASPTEPQTDAPSSNPSSYPTTSPSSSPTGRLDGCEEGSIVICGENDDEGIEFCLENGRNTVCLPLDFVRPGLEAGGVCGPCPETREPTPTPTGTPTPVPTTRSPAPSSASPTVAPTLVPTTSSAPTLECSPRTECNDGNGVEFCFNGESGCVANENVQLGLSLGGSCGPCPSESPTMAPTAAPSAGPTTGPTEIPTAATVTEEPSPSPSTSPTDLPTLPAATLAPSSSPTQTVTASPTVSPTGLPSASPTIQVVCDPEVPCDDDTGVFVCFEAVNYCIPPGWVGEAIEIKGAVCGTCPTPTPTSTPTTSPTVAPPTPEPTPGATTLSPTAAPTGTPSASPTASPTIECDVIETCPTGILFCVTSDDYAGGKGTWCVDENDIQHALKAGLGECGPCPETLAPTATPTELPTTPAATGQPTPGPGGECETDDWVFKCGRNLYICGNVDTADLCNHGNWELDEISEEECEELIAAVESGDGCEAKCPNGNSISNFGSYGSCTFKCDCGQTPDVDECEECASGFVASYSSGCDVLQECDNTNPPSYVMCGRDGAGEQVEFCAWPEAIAFVLDVYPMSSCGAC